MAIDQYQRLRWAIDPPAFAADTGIDLDPWQREVLEDASSRILLNCSRQSGKTTIAGLKATHVTFSEPGETALILAPSMRQSKELFGGVRWAVNALGLHDEVETLSAMRLRWKNGSRVVALPGKHGSIRGFSAVRQLIIDEGAFVDDETYNAVRPFLAVRPEGKAPRSLMAISTPYGKRGWWYRAWEKEGDLWSRYRVTAESCPRIRQEFLDAERVALGDWWFQQEYFCEFLDSDSLLFTAEDIAGAFANQHEPVLALQEVLAA